MLKLGRFKFCVKEFQCELQTQSIEEIRKQELNEALQVVSLEQSEGSARTSRDHSPKIMREDDPSNSTNTG